MKKIDTLSSMEGRELLRQIFRDIRFEQQVAGLVTLITCWRICISGTDINRYTDEEVSVLHSLGFFSGTVLWMEEIVNRFYFTTINSFVYFGAAVLLVIIGIRRFTDMVDNTFVIGGIVFEALMLIMMFIVMLFSPNDENGGDRKESGDNVKELVDEVGEIGRDFAAVVMQLEQLGNSMSEMIRRQDQLLNSMNQIAENTSNAVSPNPKMLETMNETNKVLDEFKSTVKSLNTAAESLKKEEIEMAVRKELERVFADRVNKT